MYVEQTGKQGDEGLRADNHGPTPEAERLDLWVQASLLACQVVTPVCLPTIIGKEVEEGNEENQKQDEESRREQEQIEHRPEIDVLKTSSATSVPTPKEDGPTTGESASRPHQDGGVTVVDLTSRSRN